MKVLLIMPNFFGYPREIKEKLENLGYKVDLYDDRPSTNSVIKAVIRLKKNLLNVYIAAYFRKIISLTKRKKYDYVFFISGQSLSFSKEMMIELRNSQSQAKFVLYQWDSIKNFRNITEMYDIFDSCYTFDQSDTIKYKNLKFLPLFFSDRYEEIGKSTNKTCMYDFSFVGTAHPRKYRLVTEMADELRHVYSSDFVFFYYQSPLLFLYRKIFNKELRHAHYKEFNYTPLTEKQIINVISKSDIILDAPQDGQKGLTIRTIEALGAKKKLITTNQEVKNYDFYRKENIYVYNGSFDFNDPFFNKPYKNLYEDTYKKYSLESWLLTILKN